MHINRERDPLFAHTDFDMDWLGPRIEWPARLRPPLGLLKFQCHEINVMSLLGGGRFVGDVVIISLGIRVRVAFVPFLAELSRELDHG